MDAAGSAPTSPEVPTLRQQAIMVAAFAGFMMICLGMQTWEEAMGEPQGKANPYEAIAMLANGIGCALWIAMDRKRRGQEPGILRWAGLFLGPGAVCLQLILDYKARSLFLLPLVVALYLAILIVPYVAVVAFQRFWS